MVATTDETKPAQFEAAPAPAAATEFTLDAKDSVATVSKAVKKLGYDLSEEDLAKVYEAFQNVAEKKSVGTKELEAIVASAAMQVPPTYKLVSHVTTVLVVGSSVCWKRQSLAPEAGLARGPGSLNSRSRQAWAPH